MSEVMDNALVESFASFCDQTDDLAEEADDDSPLQSPIENPRSVTTMASRRPLAIGLRSIYDAPDFVKRLQPTEELEIGETVKFMCIISGFPTPSVKWYQDDEGITDNSRFKFEHDGTTGTHAVIIENVSKWDEGAYKCKAENTEGVSSSTGFLTVKKAESKKHRPKSPRRSGKRGVSYPTPFFTISEITSDGEKEEDHVLETHNYYNSFISGDTRSTQPPPPSPANELQNNAGNHVPPTQEEIRERLSHMVLSDGEEEETRGYCTKVSDKRECYLNDAWFDDSPCYSNEYYAEDSQYAKDHDDLGTHNREAQTDNLYNQHRILQYNDPSFSDMNKRLESSSTRQNDFTKNYDWNSCDDVFDDNLMYFENLKRRKSSLYSISVFDQGLTPLDTFIIGVPMLSFAALCTNLSAELFIFFMIIATLQQCVLHSLNIL